MLDSGIYMEKQYCLSHPSVLPSNSTIKQVILSILTVRAFAKDSLYIQLHTTMLQ